MRAGLASLGLRSLDELIGRADLLRQRGDLKLAKTGGLNLAFLTAFAGAAGPSSERLAAEVHSNGPQLDDVILADSEVGGRGLGGPVLGFWRGGVGCGGVEGLRLDGGVLAGSDGLSGSHLPYPAPARPPTRPPHPTP